MLSTVPLHNSPLHRRRMVWENLERLRSCADLDRGRASQRVWRQILEMTPGEFERAEALESDVPDEALERVASRFGIATPSLLQNSINFREVAIRINPRTELPEPFTVAAFGRRRSTITSLDYIEKKSGWRVKRDVFRRFGVNEAMFSNSMAPISMSFMTEISKFMGQVYGYDRHALYEMGANLYVDGRSALIENVFSSCRGPAELYSRFFGDMMKFFELNCQYEIVKLDDKHCIFDVRSRSEVAEALRVPHLGCRELCSVKAGFISSMSAYVSLPFAEFRELSCVHLGDATCRYELTFSRGKPSPSLRSH